MRLVILLLLVVVSAAFGREITFVVRTGTDAEGNPQFRVADSRDGHLLGMFELTQSSRALQEVARYSDSVQQAQGASPLPVFVEVTNGSSNYNDWKGRFSVASADGRNYTVSAPRVVIGLASDAVRSGDRGLLEQTLVHEVGHGAMAQAYGSSLPQTPWLSKPHSGGTVTDEQLALIEGWAEFVGAYFTGRRTIAEDPQDTLVSNWYAKRADGGMKSASELVRTEGWNATVMYQIATRGRDQNAMWKMTQVMAGAKPQSSMELLARLGTTYPELAPTIQQVLQETSGGQISNPGFGAVTAQSVPAAAGAAGSMDATQLGALYQAKSQEYARTTWWSIFKKMRLKRELEDLARMYAQSQGAGTYTAAPGAPAAPVAAPAAPVAASAPAGPAAPTGGATALRSYRQTVEALGTGAATPEMLQLYDREQKRRRAERGTGPGSER